MTKRNITQQATVNPMSDSASVNALKYQFITGMELAGISRAMDEGAVNCAESGSSLGARCGRYAQATNRKMEVIPSANLYNWAIT